MNDLNDHIKAGLMAFKHEADDSHIDRAVLVEATDRDNGEFEIAFDVPRRNERLYLRFKTAELLALIPKRRTRK